MKRDRFRGFLKDLWCSNWKHEEEKQSFILKKSVCEKFIEIIKGYFNRSAKFYLEKFNIYSRKKEREEAAWRYELEQKESNEQDDELENIVIGIESKDITN